MIGTNVELRFINDNVEVWLIGVDYETVQHVVIVVEVSNTIEASSHITIYSPEAGFASRPRKQYSILHMIPAYSKIVNRIYILC